jgi:carbamoyltransferase
MHTTGYILAIARGHNAGACLLKDGKVVFSIEEERLSRMKYDGGPYASMMKVLEYTKKIDYLVIAHTQGLDTAGRVDYSGDDVYTGLARKLGLIENHPQRPHPQVIDMSHVHHKLHAAAAFYRSGFAEAAAVIVDGAGTFIELMYGDRPITTWEVESIFTCEYPNNFSTVYKHLGTRENIPGAHLQYFDSTKYDEPEGTHELLVDDRAGIVKVYEAVTQYCGFSPIEAGKTMGLFPYGKKNAQIPNLFDDTVSHITSNRNVIVPTYPNAALVNDQLYSELSFMEGGDVTKLKNRRDLAYAVQTETQAQVVKLIRKAVEQTGQKNIVISGGYGLNCVANYHYLDALKDLDVSIYVEPISNDAGTAMGAALYHWHKISRSTEIASHDTLYLGPAYTYTDADITDVATAYDATVRDVTKDEIVTLLRDKNIVAMFQGRSENGPRALGNRSLLFDPTFEDGKDFVNKVKRREYFRPFAGTILAEHVHEWFDLRGMKDTPFMMYAVNCQPGVAKKIPSIIHVDGTCRIQTVTETQNKHFHELITHFHQRTGIPVLFNTSFNLGGEPLVETLEDAIRTLANSDIEYLYLPELNKLIEVKNVVA